MRLLKILTCLLLAVPAVAETIVFRNVSVIPMTSPRVLEKQSVVVRDGRIQLISKTPAIPKGATVIDGTGKFLIPGLADMHVHVPAVDAKGDLLPDTLLMLLANGVTTARGMFGFPGQLAVREKAKNGELVSPTLYLAGPVFSNTTVATPEEVVARVRQQKKEGWDLLKVHDGLTVAQYDALAKTARAEGMRFGGHLPVPLDHAIEMGQETFEHMDGFVDAEDTKGPIGDQKLAALVKKSKDAGIWIVPTLAMVEGVYGVTPLETLQAYPELKYSPQAAVDVWTTRYNERLAQLSRRVASNVIANRRRIFRAMHGAGVKILLGTDSLQEFLEPGFSVLHEMESMRAAGLTPYEILRTATVTPGQYFAKQDSFGTIEPGKRADLVLLDGNPLADIANIAKISGVMARGRWYSREQLDVGLKRVTEKYRIGS
jgi:imidazolonepropionase-like amidohydrolase